MKCFVMNERNELFGLAVALPSTKFIFGCAQWLVVVDEGARAQVDATAEDRKTNLMIRASMFRSGKPDIYFGHFVKKIIYFESLFARFSVVFASSKWSIE